MLTCTLKWEKLAANGGSQGQCGWLKDQFGVSWQVVPSALVEVMTGDPEKDKPVMDAMMKMNKLDVEGLRSAANQG